jgi:hypothetical protein
MSGAIHGKTLHRTVTRYQAIRMLIIRLRACLMRMQFRSMNDRQSEQFSHRERLFWVIRISSALRSKAALPSGKPCAPHTLHSRSFTDAREERARSLAVARIR